MNGILVIDKPKEWTSHDVVSKVRRLFGEKRIGHTGTLDPLATGVLVLCIGKATRITRYLEGDDKEYIAELKLGITTDTQDAEGRVLESREYLPPTYEQVRDVLDSFRGRILQRPPAFSALKVNGVPSHRLARKGAPPNHEARPVTITDIRLLDYADPVARLSVCCSKGTYIRTLCADIGYRLGMGAHLISLVRTRAGQFLLEKALTLEKAAELAALGKAEKALISLMDAVSGLPALTIDEDASRRIAHGNAVSLPKLAAVPHVLEGLIRVISQDGRFLAVAMAGNGLLKPEVVLV